MWLKPWLSQPYGWKAMVEPTIKQETKQQNFHIQPELFAVSAAQNQSSL